MLDRTRVDLHAVSSKVVCLCKSLFHSPFCYQRQGQYHQHTLSHLRKIPHRKLQPVILASFLVLNMPNGMFVGSIKLFLFKRFITLTFIDIARRSLSRRQVVIPVSIIRCDISLFIRKWSTWCFCYLGCIHVGNSLFVKHVDMTLKV